MARSLIDESLAICRQVGDPWNLAFTLWVKMCVAGDEGDDTTATACGQEGLALFREIGDSYFANVTQAALGSGLVRKNQDPVGRAYIEEALKFFQESGGSRGAVLFSITCMVSVTYFQQDFHQLAAYAQEALAVSRELGMRWLEAGFLRKLGAASKHLGDLEQAATYFQESLSIMQAMEDLNGFFEALEGMAGVAAADRKPIQAIHLLGAVEALFEPLPKKMRPMEKAEFRYDIALARSQLDEATFTAAWAEGRAMSQEQAMEYALRKNSAD
jgi:tetratricopeptide (TPR) repeat protein